MYVQSAGCHLLFPFESQVLAAREFGLPVTKGVKPEPERKVMAESIILQKCDDNHSYDLISPTLIELKLYCIVL